MSNIFGDSRCGVCAAKAEFVVNDEYPVCTAHLTVAITVLLGDKPEAPVVVTSVEAK